MTLHPEYQYLDLLQECLVEGEYRVGRNGGTYGLFGRQIRFDLSKGFPLLTTKKLYWKAIAIELIWFLRGDTNIKFLQDNGVHIWDEWADAEGDLGPVYGAQWRYWGDTGVDQIRAVIEGLRNDPNGRRHIVTAWNPEELIDMALPPCHCLFQFFVANGKLSCQLYQRSADIFLGVPFNIASYALLTHLIASEVGLEVGEFVHTFGDVHLYENHREQATIQLGRSPKPFPRIELAGDIDIVDKKLGLDNIILAEYEAHPAIKAEVSV